MYYKNSFLFLLVSLFFLTYNSKTIAQDNLAPVKNSQLNKQNSSLKKIRDINLSLEQAKSLIDSIDKEMHNNFYNKNLVQTIWEPNLSKSREELESSASLLDFSSKINDILRKLNTSHTQFLTINDESYFFLSNLFASIVQNNNTESTANSNSNNLEKPNSNLSTNNIAYTGLGMGDGIRVPRNKVVYILDGSPAKLAGFERGDIIVSINGRRFDGYNSWLGLQEKQCKILVNRADNILEIKMAPRLSNIFNEYRNATEKSKKIIEQNNKKIAYIHLWSGGPGLKEILEDSLCEDFSNCDALIFDLRDGYGGASIDFLDPFFRPAKAYPIMQSTNNFGKTKISKAFFNKPIIVLINSGTRSGKEMLAYGLKNSQRATLIGQTTAGAFLGGSFYSLSDERCKLYLATLACKLDDKKIEGQGINPDIEIIDELGQKDLVLDYALSHIEKEKKSKISRPKHQKHSDK